MADADSEDLLIDTEYNLYVLSQEIDSDARYELPKLREKLDRATWLGPDMQGILIKHLDSAISDFRKDFDRRGAAWHLWKVHRALTGRNW